MAKNNNLTDFLTDIAATIRNNEGTTDNINPQDFSSRIQLNDSTFSITSLDEQNVRKYKTAKVVDSNLIAANIKKDIQILGITGTYESGSTINIQNLKTVNAQIDSDNTTTQTIKPDSGFDAIAVVKIKQSDDLMPYNIRTGSVINGVTGNFSAGATATADTVIKGKTAYVNGVMITGTYEPPSGIEEISNLTTLNKKLIRDNLGKWYLYTGPSNNNIATGTVCNIVADNLNYTWKGHQGVYSQDINFTETIDFYSHNTLFDAIKITQSGTNFIVQYIYTVDGVNQSIDVWDNEVGFNADYANIKFTKLPSARLQEVLDEMATQGVKFSYYTNVVRHINGTAIERCFVAGVVDNGSQLIVKMLADYGSYTILIDKDYTLTVHSTNSTSYNLTIVNAATQNSQTLYDVAWGGAGNTSLNLLAGAYHIKYGGAGSYNHILTVN